MPFRLIPGVTAGLAGLAAAKIPATMRGINQAVIFAAGHGADPGVYRVHARVSLRDYNIVSWDPKRACGLVVTAFS